MLSGIYLPIIGCDSKILEFRFMGNEWKSSPRVFLGYSDFRSKKIIMRNAGSTIMCVPNLVLANTIGSPRTHMIMHTTALMHSAKTEVFLPLIGPLPL
jgi:hypothetical protein